MLTIKPQTIYTSFRFHDGLNWGKLFYEFGLMLENLSNDLSWWVVLLFESHEIHSFT